MGKPVHVDEREHSERLAEAAAVLLLEMAATDQGMGERELEAVHDAMRGAFGMDDEAVREVMQEAGELQRQAVSLHRFTEQIRTGLANERRVELMENLWRVAYADGHLDRYEEHFIRRLADLLGVPHREFVRTKLRVGGSG